MDFPKNKDALKQMPRASVRKMHVPADEDFDAEVAGIFRPRPPAPGFHGYVPPAPQPALPLVLRPPPGIKRLREPGGQGKCQHCGLPKK